MGTAFVPQLLPKAEAIPVPQQGDCPQGGLPLLIPGAQKHPKLFSFSPSGVRCPLCPAWEGAREQLLWAFLNSRMPSASSCQPFGNLLGLLCLLLQLQTPGSQSLLAMKVLRSPWAPLGHPLLTMMGVGTNCPALTQGSVGTGNKSLLINKTANYYSTAIHFLVFWGFCSWFF